MPSRMKRVFADVSATSIATSHNKRRCPVDTGLDAENFPSKRPKQQRKPIQLRNEQAWQRNLLLLQQYLSEHGDLLVPRQYPVLGNWCANQRDLYRKKRLHPQREQHLRAIGFFDTNNARRRYRTWEEQYDALVQYKVLYGNVRVPQNYVDDPGLGRWVVYMRDLYKKQSPNLSPERIDKLNAVDFVWTADTRRTVGWKVRFAQLQEFQREHGHTRVPLRYSALPQLGHWVQTQRTAFQDRRLLPERQQLLESIGFNFVPQKAKKPSLQWERCFEQLAQFQKEHGHTRVPSDHSNQALARWTRAQSSGGGLSGDQAKRLEDIGFCFVVSGRKKLIDSLEPSVGSADSGTATNGDVASCRTVPLLDRREVPKPLRSNEQLLNSIVKR